MGVSSDKNARKRYQGGQSGTDEQRKESKTLPGTQQPKGLYIRLLVKQFGGLSEELIDGFFVALRFCLMG